MNFIPERLRLGIFFSSKDVSPAGRRFEVEV
jgi:hypothetical protein